MNNDYLIQRLIINDLDSMPEDLFHRGKYKNTGGTLVLSKQDGMVEFNTYFNYFFASQWKKLTGLGKVSFKVLLCGNGSIDLVRQDFNGNETVLGEYIFSSAVKEEFYPGKWFSLDELGDALYLKIRAGQSPVTVYGGAIITDSAPKRELNIACCFCTYKREKDIKRNVRALLSELPGEDSLLKDNLDIYVADNGHTLSPDDFGSSDKVFLFENKNYGGSGGFTRCLIEAGIKKKGTYTHLILMDDDALIRPYVVERTALLLRYLSPEFRDHLIGGALFSLRQPWLQAENGAEFINRGVIPNGAPKGRKKDLREPISVLKNQEPDADVNVNFNAWIFACLPSEFVTEANLPLPFFLHGDDIEYGLRFQGKIIRMNGICVWHPDPSANKRPNTIYYDHRNYTIIEALNTKTPNVSKYCVTEFLKIMRMMTEYQYEGADYAIRGCTDFLKGIDWFKQVNPESLNRDVLSWKPYPPCHVDDVQGLVFETPYTGVKTNRIKQVAGLFLPVKKERVYYDYSFSWSEIDFRRNREVSLIDRQTGDGITLRRDWGRFLTTMKDFFHLTRELRKNYRRISEEWKDRIIELQSYDFWKKYLEIE